MDGRKLESGSWMLEGFTGLQELLRRARVSSGLSGGEVYERAVSERSADAAATMAKAAANLRKLNERFVSRAVEAGSDSADLCSDGAGASPHVSISHEAGFPYGPDSHEVLRAGSRAG